MVKQAHFIQQAKIKTDKIGKVFKPWKVEKTCFLLTLTPAWYFILDIQR